ncbi:MAG: hypothetical protein AAFO96_03695 [Bacteroidota bacterium]
MLNRNHTADLNRLAYEIEIKPLKIADHPKMNVGENAVLSIRTADSAKGKPDVKVVSTRVSPKMTFEVKKQKNNCQKVQPVAVYSKIFHLYHTREKDYRPVAVSIDPLENGGILAITFGKGIDASLPLPLYEAEIGDVKFEFYRVYVYRYDQCRNGYYLEIQMTVPEMKTVTLWRPIPQLAPSLQPEVQKKNPGLRYEEQFLQIIRDTLKSPKNPQEVKKAMYLEMFKGYKMSDFPDKATKKYREFVEMLGYYSKACNSFEEINQMASAIAFILFYGNHRSDQKSLVDNIIGYRGEQFNAQFEKMFKG